MIAALVLGLSYGCAKKQIPFDPGFQRERYLCCNMLFDLEHVTTDANYERYREGDTRLAAGTKILVVNIMPSEVAFQPVDGTQVTYRLFFEYGSIHQSAQQYFEKIFLPVDPLDSIKTARPDLAAAIHEGRLLEGMTKAQTLLARGYPPAHQTPSLGSAEWVYYQTPLFVDRVHFVDNKIQSITTAPAP